MLNPCTRLGRKLDEVVGLYLAACLTPILALRPHCLSACRSYQQHWPSSYPPRATCLVFDTVFAHRTLNVSDLAVNTIAERPIPFAPFPHDGVSQRPPPPKPSTSLGKFYPGHP